MVELHDKVAVPDPLMLLGLIGPQAKPVGTASVRATVLVRPFTAVTVRVERAEDPGETAGGEVAPIVKSWNWKVACARRVAVPFEPVIVIVYVAAIVEVHETIALPEPVTLAGVIALQARPRGILSLNAIFPANPLRGVTVTVELADCPTSTGEEEVADRTKSGPAWADEVIRSLQYVIAANRIGVHDAETVQVPHGGEPEPSHAQTSELSVS